MKKRSKTQLLAGICAMILVIAVQSGTGQRLQRSTYTANLSANRGFGIGVASNAHLVLGGIEQHDTLIFLSYCPRSRLDLQILSGFSRTGSSYLGGTLRYRLIDNRAFDILANVEIAFLFSPESLSLFAWGGSILGCGVIAEYSITRHLPLSAELGIRFLALPDGFQVILKFGLSLTYYF